MTIDPHMRVALTATLETIMDDEPAESRQRAGLLLLKYLEGFALVHQENPSEPPVAIAARLHEATDGYLQLGKERAADTSKDISCRKGCAHCCHMRTSVLDPEAQLLFDTMKQKGIVIDQARLAKQLRWTNDADWLRQPVEDRRCVFLSDQNECQVYDQRPISCRKYFVVSDPDLCNIDKHPKGRVAIWFDTNSEIIASAEMTYYGVDSLPRQLLKAARGKITNPTQPQQEKK